MSAPGIFKLGRVSIMLQIWHLASINYLLTIWVSEVELLVLMSICIWLGGCQYAHRVALMNKCLAAACCCSASILS